MAAKTFWLAARRATGALEVVKVVPKVSPGARGVYGEFKTLES